MISINEETLAMFCRSSYTPLVQARKQIEDSTGFPMKAIRESGASAIVCETEHDIIVSCRGTVFSGFLDVLTDSRSWITTDGIHSGFAAYAAKLREELRSVLRNGRGKMVWFVGHSMGGALATIFYEEYAMLRWFKCRLFTLGCPRVYTGRRAQLLADKLGSESCRFVRGADVVPRFPHMALLKDEPLYLSLSLYKHVMPADYIASDGVVYRGSDRTHRALDSFLRVARDIEAGWKDHTAERYHEDLKVWAKYRRDSGLPLLIGQGRPDLSRGAGSA